MRGLAGTDSREDDEAAKIDLTYSTTRDINRAGPTFEMLVVCIIQVSHRQDCVEEVAFDGGAQSGDDPQNGQ